MTCSSCEAKVKSALLLLPNVTEVEVSREKQTATISMDKHIPLNILQNSLDKKYTIIAASHSETAEQAKSWLNTYKPVLLIFVYIITITALISSRQNGYMLMESMNIFMAGFFLTFSFFKMLDLKGFAESYAMYDLVAGKVFAWGYIYAFIELLLGLAYAVHFEPLITNIITLTVMTVSITGVLKALFNKKQIQCACLGAVFNLPMSTVTIIEDGLMIAMSIFMISSLL